jgi:anhydro-N-acetylmuramic acid kinase
MMVVVAGVMSGTSADGVDVALCRIGPGASKGDPPRVKFLGLLGTPYPKAVRDAVLRVMEGEPLPAAEMSRLSWRLGGIYADCVERAAAKFGVRVALVGCHGQTVHHEAAGTRFLGAKVRSTWQMGEAAMIAERMRCPVVSDFRPADLAAGGQGAPLVPMLDWCMFRDKKVNRILLNLGGIANITAIPAGCGLEDVLAFDTGPGNMVIDAVMQQLFGKPYDDRGRTAGQGKFVGSVVNTLLKDAYFRKSPPKSCGREQFGADYAERLRELVVAVGQPEEYSVAVAMQLTLDTILKAYLTFCQPRLTDAPTEVVVAGGGARNDLMMKFLRTMFGAVGAEMRSMEELGIPTQGKEGVAFALLAWLTWNGMTGNVPAATGAGRGVVLGKVSYG